MAICMISRNKFSEKKIKVKIENQENQVNQEEENKLCFIEKVSEEELSS